MSTSLTVASLWDSTRAKVFLLWAAIVGVGFVATHYYQHPNINGVWFVLSAIGFYYMYRVMPMNVRQMKHIYASWLIPITIGIGISAVAVRTNMLPGLVGYLGVFWLLIMAGAYVWNGLVDRPLFWYLIAALINIGAAALCYYIEGMLQYQYLIAAVASVWSMLNLWLFRSEV
jgi:hypothetical protein